MVVVIEFIVSPVTLLVFRACQSCIQSIQCRWWSRSTTWCATNGQTCHQAWWYYLCYKQQCSIPGFTDFDTLALF